MPALQRRHNKWRAKIRVPERLQADHGGRKFLQKTLEALDRPSARLEAAAWELKIKTEWAAKSDAPQARSALRELYRQIQAEAEAGVFILEDDPHSYDAVTAGIGYELEKIEERHGRGELPEAERVRVMALQDAAAARMGRVVPPRKELEPTFRELADEYLKLWKTQHELKETNTEQQKVATFDLFGGYWGSRPIREVRKKDAAEFLDALRQMNPMWGKSPKARSMSWPELQENFGGQAKGMSDATINRHAATLKSYWAWAQERDYCEGNNPFSGFHKRLKEGRNVKGYLAWEPHELEQLFNPPPKRRDVTEVMLVAMYSGMRLDEIASLTRGQIRTEAGVTYANVVDAKTAAGERRVPIHPELSWLAKRAEGDPAERIWPRFNCEGPGKKAGADAGKEFSRFKLARGFASRRKAFHSFRKNFVGQLEEAGVPQSDAAHVVGHEVGFTYRTYNPNGLSLQRLADIVALIRYPGLSLPNPGDA
ncbi:tyrosine-type recombinase/integrase [Tsuneonella sp. YG55]|uniref:Tyrosine-type recombinase/integrase n=1 Tax=Tsuneonella litorea TaxID=2976475 RepID=A0A9X2W1X5_9SPHN|nr:tyrosine-type recombinase/integrase [Tsuneonella litorea]MCT2558416.1 tyrosine-type recombinase/integrase [Tsuneonella litorea]